MSLQSIATDQLKQAKVLGIDLGIILAVAVVAFYIAGSIKQGAYYSASCILIMCPTFLQLIN